MYLTRFSIRATPFQLRFSRILAKTYKDMMDNYIVDRQESDTSIVNLTVQIFSVKSIAHILFEEENLLAKVVDFYRDLVDRKYASGLKPLRVKTGMESNQNHFRDIIVVIVTCFQLPGPWKCGTMKTGLPTSRLSHVLLT